MKQTFFNHKTLGYMSVCMFLSMIHSVPLAYATTVVNYVHSQSNSGGQVLNGQDGEDGQDGKTGKDGKNVFRSDAEASVFVKSVIDGVTVFESGDVNVVEQKASVQVATKTATSVDKTGVSVHLTAEAGLGAEAGQGAEVGQGAEAGLGAEAQTYEQREQGRYEQMQELVSTIRLILISYVSKLF
jgi:hypothetical protein